MNLKGVLENVSRAKFAGGALSEDTIAALTRHRARSAMIGLVVVVAVLAGAIFTAYLSYNASPNPRQIAVVTGGLGLSLGAALLLLLRVWREWSQSGLLLILIEDADEATVRNIIDKLTSKL